jgi:calpain
MSLTSLLHIQDAFQKSNTTKTWKLTPQQFFEALKTVGFDIDARTVNMLIYRYGTPYNTLLFEDFIMCAVKMSSMIERFTQKSKGNKESAIFSMNDWIVNTLYS